MKQQPKPLKVKQDGTRILPPDLELKRRLGNLDIKKILSKEVVQKAEKVLEKGKKAGISEMKKNLVKLEEAFEKAISQPKRLKDHLGAICDESINIKGLSGMFGYDLATKMAGSLFVFCNKLPCLDEISIKLIEKHIEALKLIYQEKISGDGGKGGMELYKELKTYADNYRPKPPKIT